MDRSSIAGFTILEIFVAIFIITVSAITITFFTRNTMRNYSNAYTNEIAFACAEEKLSDLKAAPIPSSGNDKKIIDRDTFSIAWTVPANGTPKTVTINVTWKIMSKVHTITAYGAVK